MDMRKMASANRFVGLERQYTGIPSPIKLWFRLLVSDNGSTEILVSYPPAYAKRNFRLILLMNVTGESAIRPYFAHECTARVYYCSTLINGTINIYS